MNAKKQSSPLNILLADDDSDDRLFFDKALKELTILNTLTTVHDGEHLMKYLSENKQLPDVLFLDLNMPQKNGFECLVEIKENEKLKDLYVVMFSTSIPKDKHYELNMISNLFKFGASDFICKSGDLN